ncbi:hypothetical protein BDV98DRAFT_593364 [Pterulicium gracile]|uniref:Uncharacterized protein n=1 Tax=Pterulicium gracile TaxID=1884261 RepID=A0A5C3QSY3_9AGAR|nr:hypothetical protein BDV98DRAFT_593364 [Pterula gracilis]
MEKARYHQALPSEESDWDFTSEGRKRVRKRRERKSYSPDSFRMESNAWFRGTIEKLLEEKESLNVKLSADSKLGFEGSQKYWPDESLPKSSDDNRSKGRVFERDAKEPLSVLAFAFTPIHRQSSNVGASHIDAVAAMEANEPASHSELPPGHLVGQSPAILKRREVDSESTVENAEEQDQRSAKRRKVDEEV